MSQENVEIVREAYAAFNRRDLDHWIEFFDPEIEYHDTPDFPGGGMHLGREAFRRHAESYLDAWSDSRVEIDARAVGEQVVGRIRYTGAGRATGIQVETPEVGALYDFRAGRIRRVRQFATYAEALEAAGLRE
jgi:ketosteroid isomerase-like protein